MAIPVVQRFPVLVRFPKLPVDGYEDKQIGFELLNVLAAIFELYQNGILKLWKRAEKAAKLFLE